MKYVGVRHKPEQTKIYWFVISDEVIRDSKDASELHYGDLVLCKTRIGDQAGMVVAILDVDKKDDEYILKLTGGHKPTMPIIAVYKLVDINEIKIPLIFLKNPPQSYKIQKRRNTSCRSELFLSTDIVISGDRYLIDGYSAYMVARERGYEDMWLYVVFESAGKTA